MRDYRVRVKISSWRKINIGAKNANLVIKLKNAHSCHCKKWWYYKKN